MSENVAAAATPVDPLYEKISTKVQKQRFPAGKPAPPPQLGMIDAVEAMATFAGNSMDDEHNVNIWKFFDDNDECVSTPCASCTEPQNPRLTKWWASVMTWSAEQRKQEEEVEKSHGDIAALRFRRKRKQQHKRLRSDLSEVWSTEHPMMRGKWKQDMNFQIEFQDDDDE